MTIKFVQSGEDALLIGSPGTGKSHIAKTVAHTAAVARNQVIYRETHIFLKISSRPHKQEKEEKLTNFSQKQIC